jgi:hypothetical protein
MPGMEAPVGACLPRARAGRSQPRCCRARRCVEHLLAGEREALGERPEDPAVGLVVDEEVDLVERDAAASQAATVPSASRRTACLKVSWPSIASSWVSRSATISSRARRRCRARPARSRRGPAEQTIAPAPSPNSAAVLRSCGSTWRDMISAPITSALRAPPQQHPARCRERGDEARAGAADVEGAGPLAPSSCATTGAALGITESWLQLATSTRSISRAVDAGVASAAAPASRGELGELRARIGVAARADSGALDDPLVGDADQRRDLGVLDDALGAALRRRRRSPRRWSAPARPVGCSSCAVADVTSPPQLVRMKRSTQIAGSRDTRARLEVHPSEGVSTPRLGGLAAEAQASPRMPRPRPAARPAWSRGTPARR